MNHGVERIVRRAGVRVARADRTAPGHLALVRIIERAIPRLFSAEAAGDLDAVFELEITGRPPAYLGLQVKDERLAVRRGRPPNSGASVSIAAADMVRLVTGDTGWPELLSSGRLSLSGDPFLALRFPQLFGLPAHPGRPIVLDALRRSA
jgi:hypothetical protein